MSKDLLIPNISRIQPSKGVGTGESRGAGGAQPKPGEFAGLLRDQFGDQGANLGGANQGTIQFSKHALQRAQERGIPLTNDLMNSLEKAVASASAKGSKSTLVLGQDAAFVVSVKNGTVVTVVDRANMQNNVFTNIDSTVLL